MPELPEVETVRRGLQRYVIGKTIDVVEVLDARSLKHDSVKALKKSLAAKVISSVNRRGKFLWITFRNTDVVLVIHLGMSGQVLLEKSSFSLHPHVRIRITLRHYQREIHFRDQRLFGGMHLDILEGDVPSTLLHIAPDPFESTYDQEHVVQILKGRSAGIKSLMLNQNIVSGIGNIYADEALWSAKIHYLTPGNRLSNFKLSELLDAAKAVMSQAIESGGTSFDDLYVNVNGESGWFEVDLHAYGREDEPCARCGRLIVREAWANRSSFRCPRCQPKPRTPR